MTRLEELLEQKRLIEQEIKMLKNAPVIYGRAKLEKRSPACRPDEWVLCIMSNASIADKRDRYFPISYAQNKDAAVADIPIVINDLQHLYEMLRKEQINEETL